MVKKVLKVTTKYIKIPIKKIDNDVDFLDIGVMINIDHRPLRTHHVNKIKRNFNGVINPITVMQHTKKGKYLIVDHQHLFKAVTELMEEGKIPKLKKIPCLVLCDADGNRLYTEYEEHRKLANQISFCSNDGQERTCVGDTIYQICMMVNNYREENNKHQGAYEYVQENGYFSQAYSKETIKKYYSVGKSIGELDMWGEVLLERSKFATFQLIQEEISKRKKSPSKSKLYKVTLEMNGSEANYFKKMPVNVGLWKNVRAAIEDGTIETK